MKELSSSFSGDSNDDIFVGTIYATIAGISVLVIMVWVSQDATHLGSNVLNGWLPFHQRVFNGGDLYEWPRMNKPPVWKLFSLAVAATGSYIPVILSLTAGANALTAYLIYRFGCQHGWKQAGFIAGVLFLVIIPFLNGYEVNPRQFALVGLLVGLVWKSPKYVAVAHALGALSIQYLILAFPIAIWYHWRYNNWRWQAVALYSTIGGGLVILSYLLVGLIWGPDDLLRAIRYTVLRSEQYSERYVQKGISLFAPTDFWTEKIYQDALKSPLAPLVALGVLTSFSDEPSFDPGIMIVGWAVILATPLVIRPVPTYWLLPAPFIVILATWPIDILLGSELVVMFD